MVLQVWNLAYRLNSQNEYLETNVAETFTHATLVLVTIVTTRHSFEVFSLGKTLDFLWFGHEPS